MGSSSEPLAPMVDDIGIAVIEHGERGDLDPTHPGACLCGALDYLACDGPGVESLILHLEDFHA